MTKRKKVPRQSEESEEYEVEDILSHSVKDGKTLYKISWVGYPGYVSEMTEEDLINCSELLNEYKLKTQRARRRPVKIA
ncbi:chromo' (CHRromatin Organization MOdifier) domain protein [Cooperia oncophora]